MTRTSRRVWSRTIRRAMRRAECAKRPTYIPQSIQSRSLSHALENGSIHERLFHPSDPKVPQISQAIDVPRKLAVISQIMTNVIQIHEECNFRLPLRFL